MISEENKNKLMSELKSAPIIQIACQKSGISRATYYRWRKEDPVFRGQADQAIEQGVLFINDLAESQLISLIKDKNTTAIIFWLKHRHNSYTPKLEMISRDIYDQLDKEQINNLRRVLNMAKISEKKNVNETHAKSKEKTSKK